MSYVLTVVVFAGIMFDEDKFLADVNEAYGESALRKLTDDSFGGTKAPQANIYAGAINFADMGRLGAALRRAHDAAPQADRDFVQIAWNNEHDEGFTFVTLHEWDRRDVQTWDEDDRHRLQAGWDTGFLGDEPAPESSEPEP